MSLEGQTVSRAPARRGVSVVLALVLIGLLVLPAGAAQAQAACVYRAAFVTDVTVPDNMVQAPGVAFMKVWRLRNTGTCAWGPGTEVDSLAWVGGSQLGAANVVPLTAVIGPGQTGDVSVTLTAPSTPGTYRSEWKLRRTNGQTFGLGSTGRTAFYVKFIIQQGDSGAQGERIQFRPGATVGSVQSAVAVPGTKRYLVRALAGQRMTVAIVSANNVANFSIQGVADLVPYKRIINEDRHFSFVLERTQDYLIIVQVPAGTADFVLSLAIG